MPLRSAAPLGCLDKPLLCVQTGKFVPEKSNIWRDCVDGYIDWVREHIEEVSAGQTSLFMSGAWRFIAAPASNCRARPSTSLITVATRPCCSRRAMVSDRVRTHLPSHLVACTWRRKSCF
jgi:hypothetical protein